MSELTTAVAEEAVPFSEWAKSRTFGATDPKTDDKAEPASDKEPGQAAPGDDKAADPKTAVAPEEVKAADPEDEKEDDAKTAEALTNPGAKKRLGGWAKKALIAENKAEVFRKENERLKAQLAEKSAVAVPVKTETAKTEPAKEAEAKQPKPEDFQSVDDYTAALVDWKVDQKLAARDQKQTDQKKTDTEKARASEIMQGWDAQVKAVVAEPEYTDFSDVVLKGGIQYPDFLAAALYEVDNGAKVAYQLAKDPQLLKEIAALSPARAIAKVGRLSLAFDAAPVAKTEPVKTEPIKETPQPTPKPQQSAAPTPIRASDTPTQTSVKAAEEMSTAEWIRQRNQRVGVRS